MSGTSTSRPGDRRPEVPGDRSAAGRSAGVAGDVSENPSVGHAGPGIPRRSLLRVGGISLVAALAACGHRRAGQVRPAIGTGRSERTAPTTTTTTTTEPVDPATEADITILRTASSIEHYAAGVYTEAAGLDLVAAGDVLDALRYFADQHSEHAGAFEQATARAGGIPFSKPNPVLSTRGTAQLATVRSQSDVLQFAYGIESLTAATYTANAAQFSDPVLSALATSVAAVDARHLTVLGVYLGATGAPPYPAAGLQPVAGAVAPGTGL